MEIINSFIEHYGYEGIALAVLILIMFFTQLYYYIYAYGCIPSYKNNNREVILDKEPSISIVIPMFSEDSTFIEESLPILLSQDYPYYEIVLVYVGHDNDFYEDLNLLKHSFPQIVTTKIHLDLRFPISRKMALNIGIKSAHSEHIIFSSTDCAPETSRWLSLMAKGFVRGNIVIGYSAMEHSKGYMNYIMRAWSLMHSVNWISRAIKRRPYRGTLHNVGITKELYFKYKGFNNLQMNIGEDDLFMQKIMTSDNVSVIISPRAIVRERAWGGYCWWMSMLRYFGSSFALYPSGVKNFIRWETGSRVLFFISTICAVSFMPYEYKFAAMLLFLIRYIAVATQVFRISKRLGDVGIAKFYLIYDILCPFYEAVLWIKLLKKDDRVWR